jgi:uncharacterized OB-fold protein
MMTQGEASARIAELEAEIRRLQLSIGMGLKCEECGTLFVPAYNRRIQRYCSQRCANTAGMRRRRREQRAKAAQG